MIACFEICVETERPRYRLQDDSWPNHKKCVCVIMSEEKKILFLVSRTWSMTGPWDRIFQHFSSCDCEMLNPVIGSYDQNRKDSENFQNVGLVNFSNQQVQYFVFSMRPPLVESINLKIGIL